MLPLTPGIHYIGAGDQVRTDDIFLGKEVLYQLSYTRINHAMLSVMYIEEGNLN
jgi:hypothetical protein